MAISARDLPTIRTEQYLDKKPRYKPVSDCKKKRRKKCSKCGKCGRVFTSYGICVNLNEQNK